MQDPGKQRQKDVFLVSKVRKEANRLKQDRKEASSMC